LHCCVKTVAEQIFPRHDAAHLVGSIRDDQVPQTERSEHHVGAEQGEVLIHAHGAGVHVGREIYVLISKTAGAGCLLFAAGLNIVSLPAAAAFL